jgi:hypothetical protein
MIAGHRIEPLKLDAIGEIVNMAGASAKLYGFLN